MPLHSGDTFAGYRILRMLGSGGMGEVYLAQHPRLPRHDALKILPSQVSADEEFRRRFEREADLASALWHPHIVGVHDRGEADGQLWISMDYVEGLDASRFLAKSYPSGMPVDEAVEIVTAVASALDYAHKQGLVHRDVKPANIMLTHPANDGGEQRILLTDFGIARNVGDISGLTATNMTVGTVAYAAPEQLMGEDLDGRADQYALAATAYHLITGTQLFPHSNPAVVISRHLNATPPALADSRPDLAGLDPVFAIALAKSPGDRFPRCSDFAQALVEQHPVSPVTATKPATVPSKLISTPSRPSDAEAPPKRPAKKAPGWQVGAVSAVAVVLVVVVATLAFRLWDSRQPDTRPAASAPPPAAEALLTSVAAPPPPAPPPPPPVFPDSAIDTVLLAPAEITTLVGGPSEPLMQVEQTTHGMLNNQNLVTPPSCVGMIFTGERAVFADTGYTAMQTQQLKQSANSYYYKTVGPREVAQTVVIYDTAEQAQSILVASQRQWQACAGSEVGLGTVGQNGENGLGFQVGQVQVGDYRLAVPMVANSDVREGSACEQVLAVRVNVVVGVRACRYTEPPPGERDADLGSVRNEAGPLAGAMIDKITV